MCGEQCGTNASAGGEAGGTASDGTGIAGVDSQRTMLRTWLRVIPMTRSRPISRVRSTTESASVLAMPCTPMMTARASSA